MTPAAALAAGRRLVPLTLEEVLTAPDCMGLTTASPLQRALCRVTEGRPLAGLEADPVVRRALGDVEALRGRPLQVYVVSGSRVGKTLFSAAVAIHASQTVDVTGLKPGDEPRIPILSLDKDKAKACYLHLTRSLRASSRLRSLLVREGRNELGAPAVWLRHPSGREIMVCVAAGRAAGAAVVSYFLAGVIFDEFCRMHGGSDRVVSFDETRVSALGRLLPGAQAVAIGAPWAPFGPAYEAVQKWHGKPRRELVVLRARGRDMNPWWWTEKRIAELKALDDFEGESTAVLLTEEEAQFRDAEESLVHATALERCVRKGTAPREPGCTYVAAMDPATRGHAWTLAIGTRRHGKRVIARVREWQGKPGAPLAPGAVFAEMAKELAAYGLDAVETDQWSTDALRDLARAASLRLIEWPATGATNTDMFLELGRRIDAEELELPDDANLATDLKRVKKVTTQTGVTIQLPEVGGRHCDYAPSVARVVRRWVDDLPAPGPAPGSREAQDAEQAALLKRVQERHGDRARKLPWWKK